MRDGLTNARNIITNSLPAELDDLYTQVRNRAFSAEIVVVGNPRLFNETSCAGALAITPAEQVLLNDAADLLAETTAAVAADHGFDFADPREAFEGHEVCSADPWILGYTGNLESFHPNAAGQAAYARRRHPDPRLLGHEPGGTARRHDPRVTPGTNRSGPLLDRTGFHCGSARGMQRPPHPTAS